MGNFELTTDTLLMDLFQLNEDKLDAIAEILYGIGMHCLGCAAAHYETIGQAAQEHCIDVGVLIAKLNKVIKQDK